MSRMILAQESELIDIADAVREQTGSTEQMSLSEISANVRTLSSTPSTSSIIDIVYPVGAIYMSVNSTPPNTLFGVGTWVRIQDTFLLASGSTYAAGSTGGEATHILTASETPTHTHDRGTMDINGSFVLRGLNLGTTNPGALVSTNGVTPNAFSTAVQNGPSWGNSTQYNSEDRKCDTVTFSAAGNWTGETSSVGEDGAHNNMPPYLSVYMWKRTA